MSQQGQLIRMKRTGRDGEPLWAYRYRVGGRGSKRVQRGGFASERDAAEALERELERLRRERRVVEIADPRRTGGGVPRAARRRAGDDREAALAARKGGRRLRRATSRRAALGGDRRLADRALTRLPLRRDAGAAPGARAGGRLGDDRRQPGEARRRQPVAAAQGAAPVRVVGRTRRRRRASLAPLPADGDLRGRHRASSGRMARARMARPRPGGARRLRPPLVHERSVEVPEDGGEPPRGAAADDRARSDQTAASESAERTRVPRRAGRLPRPAQLPQPGVEARAASRPGSSRCAGSTISGTPSPPSRSVPASPPSTSPATWAPA